MTTVHGESCVRGDVLVNAGSLLTGWGVTSFQQVLGTSMFLLCSCLSGTIAHIWSTSGLWHVLVSGSAFRSQSGILRCQNPDGTPPHMHALRSSIDRLQMVSLRPLSFNLYSMNSLSSKERQ